ncbi:MAG: Coenzyme F420 hydrogenase/dehydrogenase, beta subunit C-terminal domain, partial [archaeon]|nr:Coenzyme F420 hydrogenase/dehydrogenase, beta subunit C-terminal domain [archaeon]
WPIVVSASKELVKSAGTKYSPSPVHIALQDAVDNQKKSKVGIVAVPCEVQAARKMQYTQKAAYRLGIKTRLIIGLFCMESFGYNDLINFLTSKGVEPKSVTKFSISKGRFIARVEDKEALNIPLEEIKAYARSACRYCTDFTAEHADISVGSVGSPEGWSTVIVRSKKGEQVFKGACDEGYIEYTPIEGVKPGLKSVIKLSQTKKERAKNYLSA